MLDVHLNRSFKFDPKLYKDKRKTLAQSPLETAALFSDELPHTHVEGARELLEVMLLVDVPLALLEFCDEGIVILALLAAPLDGRGIQTGHLSSVGRKSCYTVAEVLCVSSHFGNASLSPCRDVYNLHGIFFDPLSVVGSLIRSFKHIEL